MAFVWLEDGRRIAYQEMGCTQEEATRSLLVLHGAFSSRLFAMPGVSRAMLLDFGVRLVSIDRPGYGTSDPNPSQTLESFTCDILTVVDQLGMGSQIWLLGYSLGCIYCWAAARYIPHRIAGIALWAPPANFDWKV
ncbi:hypothetical protein L7F22_064195 [Adiantum nelumboides]|nr:hypothetical protein [Adiantum nelumboides]